MTASPTMFARGRIVLDSAGEPDGIAVAASLDELVEMWAAGYLDLRGARARIAARHEILTRAAAMVEESFAGRRRGETPVIVVRPCPAPRGWSEGEGVAVLLDSRTTDLFFRGLEELGLVAEWGTMHNGEAAPDPFDGAALG
jgi:F420-0:gamma-glutamyl ligase